MAMDGGGSGAASGTSREYCLRWNNHQPNMVSFLSTLLSKESFADVTLVSAEGSKIQAHRIILSACSPYFEGVFESNPCKHPVVILKDVQFVDLRTIVNFIYNGEVNIEVDRINEIIQTATTLQVKGLAEVPADEFKRVSLAGRSSSPAENSSPAPVTRTQPPPPLIMSSAGRSWQSAAEPSENANDFPVRKKLKKSTSANIPYSSGSSSTNGDVTNSTGSSFESGMGTSVSGGRSVDEGIGSDMSSNDQPQTTIRPGPPPLTAANSLLPKSRSLDDGYQRSKNANNAETAMETSGYGDHSVIDDNGMGQDGGYDDLDEDGVKIEGGAGESFEDQELEEDVSVDMYYDDDQNSTDQYDGNDNYAQSGKYQEIKISPSNFERPHVPLRKLVPKTKIGRQAHNNNNNATRSMVGVGHSLSLYRQQHQQPTRNFTSRAVIGKRRRGRPLLRQPRIKRLDNESSPGGGGGGGEEQGYSSDTGEPYIRTSSSACYEPQQQQHYSHYQARSSSVEHEIISTTVHPPIPPQSRASVPIVRVSQCSPTPPGSPQHVSIPKIEVITNSSEAANQFHQVSVSGNSSTLLTVPMEPTPNISVRLAHGHLVKQVSQPLMPSHHHYSSEEEGHPSSSHANPVIRRQHSQPVQSSSRAYSSYSIVGRGQLVHILKGDNLARDEESAAYLVETPMIQLVPASVAESNVRESHDESISITLKEVGTSRSLSETDRPPYHHQTTLSPKDSPAADTGTHTEGQLVHRSGHCPALRPGPALGCNFCWNSVDSCGRVLRRKTKYFCPECHINLCIVPCFQEYHEKSDGKKKPRAKLGLPKPSSM